MKKYKKISAKASTFKPIGIRQTGSTPQQYAFAVADNGTEEAAFVAYVRKCYDDGVVAFRVGIEEEGITREIRVTGFSSPANVIGSVTLEGGKALKIQSGCVVYDTAKIHTCIAIDA